MIELEKQVSDYLDYCTLRKNLSEKTTKAYAIDLGQFCGFIGARESVIGKSDLSAYLSYLNRSFKPSTAKRKVASLRAFFAYLEFEELIADNPMKRVKTKFREPQLLPKTIPLRVIKDILKSAYGEYEGAKSAFRRRDALKNTAVLELLFATGLRVSELCSLGDADVSLMDGVIKIFGKGSKERVLQIGNKEVLSILKKYRREFDPAISSSGYFFVNRRNEKMAEHSIRQIINKYAEKSGIAQHITPHMFRHSFATLLLEEDVDIRYIQRMLGHSSIVTTQIYTHVTSQKQKKILAAKHPRNKIVVRTTELL